MKKTIRFLFIMTAALFIAVLSASAESVRTEGENYSDISFDGGYIRNNSNFSEKKALYADVDALIDECRITYNIDAPKDGNYNLTGVTSVFDAYYTTDFDIRINGGDLYMPQVKVIEKYSWTIAGRNDYMARQDFGSVRLNKGQNRLEIILRRDDPHVTDARFITIIDYLEFTPVTEEFKIKEIKALTDAANVFSKGSNAEFKIKFTDAAQEKKTVMFNLYDMTGRKVRNGYVSAAKGETECMLNLGAMLCGWYKMELSGIETDNILNPIFFSVVDSAKNSSKDSPFGIDKFKSNLYDSQRMYKAAGYMGINMVRIGNDPYLAMNNENYLETHEDLYRDAEYAEGMKTLVGYEHLGVNWSRKSPDNLLEAYEMNKNLASHYKGRGYAYEIWNEEEAQFYKQPADTYASFFKAAAIGISDGDQAAFKMPGGYGGTPENFFVRLLLRNGITDYADAYAYHNHTSVLRGKSYSKFVESVAKKHMNAALAYDALQPVWVTEAGINMAVDGNEIPADDTLSSQARYYVVGTVQQLAYGAKKSFWFRMGHFMEDGNEWGTYNKESQPYPAVNSIAMLTKILKKGEFKGTLNTVGDVEGYLFDTGDSDAAVVWSDSEGRCQLYTDLPVKVTSLDRETKEYKPTIMNGGGMVNIPVSYFPIFIEFNGRSDERNYFGTKGFEKNTAAKTYTAADRIVLQQLWEGQDEYQSKVRGYKLSDGQKQKIKFNVYNFNDTQQSGTLNIVSESAARETEIIDLSCRSFEFNIAPMSFQSFEAEVICNSNAEAGETGFLMLLAKLSDGSAISKSIAAFYADDSERVLSGYDYFENYSDITKWNEKNCGDGITIKKSSPSDGVVRFDVTSKNNNVWYWPSIGLTNYVGDEAGLTFKIRSTKGNEQNVNVYAYCTDGAYWLGITNAVSYDGEWKQVIIPWHRFLVFSGTSTEFDPKKIRSIGIGSYAPAGESSYELKELGFYRSDSPADMSDKGQPITISGITPDKKYNRNTRFHIEANVNQTNEISVRLGDRYINDYSLNDGKLVFDFTVNERGKYDLQITSTDKWNYKNTSLINFYVK